MKVELITDEMAIGCSRSRIKNALSCSMFETTTQVRVRYAETDQMGVVYYGNYATYFEIGRVEALREMGASYRAMEEGGVMLPVLDLKVKYIRPAKYDDLLTIKVTVPEMPNTRITFLYEITNEEGTLLTVGETTLVFVDMAKNRPVPIPEPFAGLFRRWFE